MSAAVAARVRVASSMRLALPALAAATLLLACSDGKPAAPRPAAAPPYKVLELKPESMPVERRLDGTIEAVNQGTVSAQTAGRVVSIEYDVNDFVPAGAVILRLRATDPASWIDVPHFCATAGHELLSAEDDGRVKSYLIRRK